MENNQLSGSSRNGERPHNRKPPAYKRANFPPPGKHSTADKPLKSDDPYTRVFVKSSRPPNEKLNPIQEVDEEENSKPRVRDFCQPSDNEKSDDDSDYGSHHITELENMLPKVMDQRSSTFPNLNARELHVLRALTNSFDNSAEPIMKISNKMIDDLIAKHPEVKDYIRFSCTNKNNADHSASHCQRSSSQPFSLSLPVHTSQFLGGVSSRECSASDFSSYTPHVSPPRNVGTLPSLSPPTAVKLPPGAVKQPFLVSAVGQTRGQNLSLYETLQNSNLRSSPVRTPKNLNDLPPPVRLSRAVIGIDYENQDIFEEGNDKEKFDEFFGSSLEEMSKTANYNADDEKALQSMFPGLNTQEIETLQCLAVYCNGKDQFEKSQVKMINKTIFELLTKHPEVKDYILSQSINKRNLADNPLNSRSPLKPLNYRPLSAQPLTFSDGGTSRVISKPDDVSYSPPANPSKSVYANGPKFRSLPSLPPRTVGMLPLNTDSPLSQESNGGQTCTQDHSSNGTPRLSPVRTQKSLKKGSHHARSPRNITCVETEMQLDPRVQGQTTKKENIEPIAKTKLSSSECSPIADRQRARKFKVNETSPKLPNSVLSKSVPPHTPLLCSQERQNCNDSQANYQTTFGQTSPNSSLAQPKASLCKNIPLPALPYDVALNSSSYSSLLSSPSQNLAYSPATPRKPSCRSPPSRHRETFMEELSRTAMSRDTVSNSTHLSTSKKADDVDVKQTQTTSITHNRLYPPWRRRLAFKKEPLSDSSPGLQVDTLHNQLSNPDKAGGDNLCHQTTPRHSIFRTSSKQRGDSFKGTPKCSRSHLPRLNTSGIADNEHVSYSKPVQKNMGNVKTDKERPFPSQHANYGTSKICDVIRRFFYCLYEECNLPESSFPLNKGI